MLKGQKAPQEMIEKKIRTDWEKFIKTINIKPWEKYADTRMKFTKNKTKKVFTLREYYNLIMSGKTGQNLIDDGYSTILIRFYNSLLKDEIHITKKEMEKEYEQGVTIQEMSKKYNIDREILSYLRSLYGIRRRGTYFFKRKQNEVSLTKHQKSFLYGTLMGDGKKMSPTSYACKQSILQEDYVIWKHSIMKNIVSPTSFQYQKLWDNRYEQYYESVVFYTFANSDIEQIMNDFYPKKKKVVTEKILNRLTNFSLAVWFMDDGTTDWNERSRIKGWNTKPTAKLCTDSFTLNECQLISSWILIKYNIQTYIKERDLPGKYRICFDTEETPKFFEIIKPYIIPSMLYKINYLAYLKHSQELKEIKAQRLAQTKLDRARIKNGEVLQLHITRPVLGEQSSS